MWVKSVWFSFKTSNWNLTCWNDESTFINWSLNGNDKNASCTQADRKKDRLEKQNIERRRQKQLSSFEAQETEAVQLHYQQRQQKKSFYHVSRQSLNKFGNNGDLLNCRFVSLIRLGRCWSLPTNVYSSKKDCLLLIKQRLLGLFWYVIS